MTEPDTDQREEMTGEELREIDSILDAIGEMIERGEGGVSAIDMSRVHDFVTCESVLRRVLRGRGLKIEAIPHDGFGSVGVIRVLASGLSIRDPQKFADAVSLASNYEIYPRTDGKIMFALTFYGMTNKIGE